MLAEELLPYSEILSRLSDGTLGSLISSESWGPVKVGVLIIEYRQRPTKGGAGDIGFARFEDHTGSVDALLFPQVVERESARMIVGTLILAAGRLALDQGDDGESPIFLVESVIPLAQLAPERDGENVDGQ